VSETFASRLGYDHLAAYSTPLATWLYGDQSQRARYIRGS
jgi:hypothetical protein